MGTEHDAIRRIHPGSEVSVYEFGLNQIYVIERGG
jgi:hypothetical protein